VPYCRVAPLALTSYPNTTYVVPQKTSLFSHFVVDKPSTVLYIIGVMRIETETTNGGVTMSEHDCQCTGCSCDAEATTTDDQGIPVCDECASYCIDEDGEVICSRLTDGFSRCHVCHQEIEWGSTQTGNPGSGAASVRLGSCDCGDAWTDTERGTWGHYAYQRDRDNQRRQDDDDSRRHCQNGGAIVSSDNTESNARKALRRRRISIRRNRNGDRVVYVQSLRRATLGTAVGVLQADVDITEVRDALHGCGSVPAEVRRRLEHAGYLRTSPELEREVQS